MPPPSLTTALDALTLVSAVVALHGLRRFGPPRQVHAEMGVPFVVGRAVVRFVSERGGRPTPWAAGLTARERVAAAVLVAAEAVATWGVLEWLVTYVQRYYPHVMSLHDAWTKRAKGGEMVRWTPFNALEAATWRRRIDRIVQRGWAGVKMDRVNLVHEGARGKIYVGCWPYRGLADLPRDGVDVVLDLTNEVPEHPDLCATGKITYYYCPVWDQCAPMDTGRYLATVRRVAAEKGDVMVHCIFGVGRSSMTAALIMVARGEVASAAEAYARIRKARPIVRWRPEQLAFVEEMAQVLRSA